MRTEPGRGLAPGLALACWIAIMGLAAGCGRDQLPGVAAPPSTPPPIPAGGNAAKGAPVSLPGPIDPSSHQAR